MSFLFFRNTHTGPNHDHFREELGRQHPLVACDSIEPKPAQGLFLIHLLDHVEGQTFDQLVAEVRKYEAQFPGNIMSIQDILEELQHSLALTAIRVEEAALGGPIS